MTQRYQFQFPPGQEPELVPEVKDSVTARFTAAFDKWRAGRGSANAVDIFMAGYKAGYGHAKDDAKIVKEVADWHTPTN
jgi:hypothetical protein